MNQLKTTCPQCGHEFAIDLKPHIHEKNDTKQLTKQIEEKFELALREREKKLQEMKKEIDSLQKKTTSLSPHLIGDVFQDKIEDLLKKNFPHDEITPIKRGAKGGDIVQKIHSTKLSLLWEVKRTQNWSNGWIQKLKEDQLEGKHQLGIIVTHTMPPQVKDNFLFQDDIWVVSPSQAMLLASLLREQLLLLSKKEKPLQENNQTPYQNFFRSKKFHFLVSTILKNFIAMQQDLEKEKRAMHKIWSERQNRLEKIIQSSSEIVGLYQTETSETFLLEDLQL